MEKHRVIRMVAHRDGNERSCVYWDLPEHDAGGVTSVNTILGHLGIFPKDGECFELSVEPIAVEAAAE